jgi:hypothetical protein
VDWTTLAPIASVLALIVAIVGLWYAMGGRELKGRQFALEAVLIAFGAIALLLATALLTVPQKSDPVIAEPSPTFTPAITPTSTPILSTSTPQVLISTPVSPPTSTPIPSHSLTINGVTVQQGQNIARVPNGSIELSPNSGPNGKYPYSTVVHLTATPNLAEATIIWEGTDSLPSPSSTVATVTMWADEFVTLKIIPATPTNTKWL